MKIDREKYSTLTNIEIRRLQKQASDKKAEIDKIVYERFRELDEERDSLVELLKRADERIEYLETMLAKK